MILIPVFALILGILIGVYINIPLSGLIGNYIAISCIAALDAICGGVRSTLEKSFRQDIFLTGFITNVLLAFFLAWLGDRIGLDLLLAVAIILGGRIFTNINIIRRYFLENHNNKNSQNP